MLLRTWQCEHLLEVLVSVLFDLHPEVVLLGPLEILLVIILETTILFSKQQPHFAFSPKMHKASSFSPSLPTSVIFCFFSIAAILTGVLFSSLFFNQSH